MIRLLLVLVISMSALVGLAQDQISVMSYNVLNFPTGNIAGREDTLRQIINHVQPDILLIQELKNDSGLQLILNESFADLNGNYEASTFVPQQSNPSSGFKLQQAMIYNANLFGLANEGYLLTEVRDLNKFTLYYKDPDLANGADTIFFYVFVMHLKSSQGTDNAEARLSMVQTLSYHQQYLPDNANMIVAGDFNLYTSEEPAYQELLDSTNSIQLKDPIDSPGDWNSSSFQPKSILTQSTRSSSIFGDGAGGGVDDRFDFILLSQNMFEHWNTIVYEPDSYYAMGNTGDCYNQSITDCSGGEWSDEILSSLYNMSDHLPIVLKLNIGVGTVSINSVKTEPLNLQLSGRTLQTRWNQNEAVIILISDFLGRTIYQRQLIFTKGANQVQLPENVLSSGALIIRVQSNTEQHTLKFFGPEF